MTEETTDGHGDGMSGEVLARHRAACARTVDSWFLAGAAIPGRLVTAVWADEDWRAAFANAIVATVDMLASDPEGTSDDAVDKQAGADTAGARGTAGHRGTTGMLVSADDGGLHLALADGGTERISVDDSTAIVIPHPVAIPDPGEWRRYAADRGIRQSVGQLSRATFAAPHGDDGRDGALARYRGLHFERTRDFLRNARDHGFAFDGDGKHGSITVEVGEGGARWSGELDLTAYHDYDTTVHDLWFKLDGALVRAADAGPVVWSEAIRMAELVCFGEAGAEKHGDATGAASGMPSEPVRPLACPARGRADRLGSFEPEDARGDTELHAARFRGGGRTVVRLVPAELVQPEALAMAAAGLEFAGSAPVGRVRERTVGFPAWPIGADPAVARRAVGLDGEVEWARGRARVDAEGVWRRFKGLIGELTGTDPRLAPTLLEELARVFEASGHRSRARRCFTEAREIERAHRLEVDPDRHERMFTEFLLAGIADDGDLAREGSDALERLAGPGREGRAGDAFERLLRLNAEVVRRGNEPYPKLARDLRAIGKVAGMGPAECDDRLFDALVGAEGLLWAPEGFWSPLRGSLARWLRGHPDRAAYFLEHEPRYFGAGRWIRLLDDSGLFDALKSDAGAYRGWLHRILVRQPLPMDTVDPTLLRILEEGSPHLAGLRLSCPTSGTGVIAVDYLDVLCAGRVEWLEPGTPRDGYRVDWAGWVAAKERRRDLTALAADPVLSAVAVDSLSTPFIAEHLGTLLEAPGARALVGRHLDAVAAAMGRIDGALVHTDIHVHRHLRYLTDPRLVDVNPRAMEFLAAFDALAALARAIRAGTPAEMAWPALEASARRLAAAHPGEYVEFLESYPAVSVLCGGDFEIVDGDAVVASGTVPRADFTVSILHVGDGAVAHQHDSYPNARRIAHWTGGPTVEPRLGGRTSESNLALTVPAPGARVTADGVLTRDDPDAPAQPAAFLYSLDGRRLFRERGKGLALDPDKATWRVVAWDPGAGGFGDEPLEPADVVGTLGIPGAPATFDARRSLVVPALPTTVDSPAGVIGGHHVVLGRWDGNMYRVFTPLGEFESPREFDQVIARPGGGVWPVRRAAPLEPGTFLPLTGRAGILDHVPHVAIHQLRPRCPAASAVMRGFTREQAAELYDALAPDPGRVMNGRDEKAIYGRHNTGVIWRRWRPPTGPDVNAAPGTRAWDVAARLLGTDDPVLVASVIHLAADAACLARDIGDSVGAALAAARGEGPEAGPAVELSDGAKRFFGGLTYLAHGRLGGDVDGAFRTLALQLAEPGETPDGPLSTYPPIEAIVGHERMLLSMLAGAFLDPGIVAELCAFCRRLVDDGVLCSGWRAVYVDGDDGLPGHRRWLDGALMAGGVRVGDSGERRNRGRVALVREVPETIGGAPVVDGIDEPMPAPEFLAALDALEDFVGKQGEGPGGDGAEGVRDIRPAIDALVEGTTMSRSMATMLLGGVTGRWRDFPDREKKTAANRDRLSLNHRSIEENLGMLQELPWPLVSAVLAAGVPEGDPANFAEHGHDGGAMAAAWRGIAGAVPYRLTEEEREALRPAVLDGYFPMDAERLLRPLNLEGLAFPELRFVAPLLILAANRRSDDPIRPFLAEQIDRLRDFLATYGGDDAERYRAKLAQPLGAPYASLDPLLTLDGFAFRVITDGLIDDLAEDLRRTYESPPGHPMDPLVSAPGEVAEAAEYLGVPPESARYYLQLLALAAPTDANIRAWNGWRKKDIDAAAAPLLDRGLLVEANRAKAARRYFLPGGWLRPSKNARPMESWKAPLHLLWPDENVRPVVEWCPPLVPVPRLFADAWRRYRSGDEPGYGRAGEGDAHAGDAAAEGGDG